LNPKKSIFGVDEGKLLGHIVLREGIKIDPARIEAIKQVPLPKRKKLLQSFFSMINFISRFILKFAKITKPISNLLKKDQEFKWGNESMKAFQNIKEAIMIALVLVSPDYSKSFQIIHLRKRTLL
jgi:hypothetical protein